MPQDAAPPKAASPPSDSSSDKPFEMVELPDNLSLPVGGPNGRQLKSPTPQPPNTAAAAGAGEEPKVPS